jgi:DNA-binding NtrC family response regulator
MSQPNHNAAAGNFAPVLFVVDDEPMLLELAGMILGPEGFDVRTFRDPDAAIEAFRKSAPRPALIITDYAMHTMTGLDLIKACKRIEPRQKIILVSGTVDITIYHDSLVKPDRFLAKPFQAKELIELVRAVLAG